MANIGTRVRTIPDEQPLPRAPQFAPTREREVPGWLDPNQPERELVPVTVTPNKQKQAA